jgi:hypothetical protein
MNGEKPMSRLDQRLNWARQQVGVAPGAPLEDVRSKFLAALARENFVPDEGLDRAFRTLRWEAEGVVDSDDPPEFVQAEESELEEAVESFAATMFSWAPAERRQRWAELYRRCEYSLRHRARLDGLASGLDVVAPPPDASGREMHLATLARHVMELFPLRPTARAARRHVILTALYRDDVKPWRKAAQTLRRKNPQLAALATDLIDQLTTAGVRKGPTQVAVRRETTRGTSWALGLAAAIFMVFIIGTGVLMDQRSSRSPAPAYRNVDVEQLLERLHAQQQSQPSSTPVSPAAPENRFGIEPQPYWSEENWGQRIDVQKEMERYLPENVRRPREPLSPMPRPWPRQPSSAGPPGAPFPPLAPPSGPPFPSGF